MSNDWVLPRARLLSWRRPTAFPWTGTPEHWRPRPAGSRSVPRGRAARHAWPATGPKVPLPAVGWWLPQKALPSFSSGSHLMPVRDFHAPSCPVGVVSSGLTLRPGPSSHRGLLLFPLPLGKFSLPLGIRRISEVSGGPSWAYRALPSCLLSP